MSLWNQFVSTCAVHRTVVWRSALPSTIATCRMIERRRLQGGGGSSMTVLMAAVPSLYAAPLLHELQRTCSTTTFSSSSSSSLSSSGSERMITPESSSSLPAPSQGGSSSSSSSRAAPATQQQLQQQQQHRQRRQQQQHLVLYWYRRILRSAMNDVTHWKNGVEDSEYIIDEARRLFRMNTPITDPDAIDRKIKEAEYRYELAMHYRIPWPRMFHKVECRSHDRTGVPYAAYLDSYLDHTSLPYAVNPGVGIRKPGDDGSRGAYETVIHGGGSSVRSGGYHNREFVSASTTAANQRPHHPSSITEHMHSDMHNPE